MQVIKDSVIFDLSLAIDLCMVGRGESVHDFILGVEARHFSAREVGPVVGDDGMGKSEVT